jgi:aminomethyltransferase
MSGSRRTPLFELHKRLGGRMVEFAGFEMPVQYSSILEEHAAVRERVGLFDVSHMGQIHFSGPEAVATVEHLVSCPVASLRPGGVRYGVLCNREGGVVDDVTIYRVAPDELFLCVNAANIEKDHRWILGHSPTGAGVEDRSSETGLLALQGPRSAELLARVSTGEDAGPAGLRRFRFDHFEIAGVPALVSKTGYTGSPGFEIYTRATDAPSVFQSLLARGEDLGIAPAGLGARDTLRLEAAFPLYGHELDDTTSPLEAGLERFVKRQAGGFIGAEAIERRAAQGHERLLVGFILETRGVARSDYPIAAAGEIVGRVTSGAPSPTLGKSIGLGYVRPELSTVGTPIEIEIRGRGVPARIVETPFVKAGAGSS